MYGGNVITLNKKCNMLIKDGTIRGGCGGSSNYYSAGGIIVEADSNLEVRNVKITGNYCESSKNSCGGAGIAICPQAHESAEVLLKNVSITKNYTNGRGCAIFINSLASTVTLDDVTITGNICNGGNNDDMCAVYVGAGYFHVRNKVKIIGNESKNGNPANLFFSNDIANRIEDCDSLTEGSEIGYHGNSVKVTYELNDPNRVLKYFKAENTVKKLYVYDDIIRAFID